MRSSIVTHWARLRGDRRGNVAMMFGLAIVPLIGLISVVLEYGFMTVEKSRLQAAADAAAVTLGPLAATETPEQLRVKAESILRAFAGDSFSVDTPRISAGGTELTLVTRKNYRTEYARFPGMQGTYPIKVVSRTIITRTFYEIALVLDNSGSMSSSAGGKSKMTAAKDAAKKLVEIMFGNPISKERTTISLVPFTLSVNVGDTYSTAPWMDLDARSSVHWENTDFATSAWKPKSKWKLFEELNVKWAGCVEHRPGDLGTSEKLPAAANAGDIYFVPQFAPDEPGGRGASSYTYKHTDGRNYSIPYPNSYLEDHNASTCPATPELGKDGSDATLKTRQNRLCKYRAQPLLVTTGRGPNYMCDAKPLTRLQKSQSVLLNQINNMNAAGNTNLLEGFMWGWRTLSPNGPFMDGKAYDARDNRKIVILMTDGMNAWNAQSNHNKSVYSPFGYYGQNRLPDADSQKATVAPGNAVQARARIDAHTAKACTNAKAQGVQVYTVGFSVSSDPIDQKGLDLLKGCATNPSMAYVASNSEGIVKVFEEIARNIGGLRIAE